MRRPIARLCLLAPLAAFLAGGLLACHANVAMNAGTAANAGNAAGRWRSRAGLTAQQVVSVHRAYAPSPSPDGGQMAFLSDAPGLPQLFVTGVGAGDEHAWQRVAPSTERVQLVRYSPDGKYLFFGRDVGGNEDWQIFRTTPAGAHVVELTNDPKVRNELGAVARDGSVFAYASNQRNGRDMDVFVRSAEGGEPRVVYDAGGSMTAADFSPDAKKLIVVHDRSNVDSYLTLVDLESLAKTPLTPHPETEPTIFSRPRFRRDGKALFLLSNQGRDFVNVATIDLAGASPAVRFVLDDAHDVDFLDVSPTSDLLAIAANVDGYHEVRLYDAADPAHLKAGPKVDLPSGVIAGMQFAQDGKSIFTAFSRASMPNEIFRIDAATGHAVRVTTSDHAGVDEPELVESTLARFKSFDGLEVPVFLFEPRGMKDGERAPVIVWVHGGPESQFTPAFNPQVQLLVSRGYIVAAPNVRGSSGYGKRYEHLDDVEKREDSVHDLAALNQWLRTQPRVMPDKIAVMGGSYGGYMTLAAITLYPALWAAACEIVGIANFKTFLEQTKPYRRALRESEYGSLARDAALLERISPLSRVDKIRAPLMVVHGSNDPRVPVNEAEQIVHALERRGVKVDYLRFDNEGHGVVRSENRVQFYDRNVRFFDDVLGK